MAATAQKSTQLSNPDELPEVKNYVRDIGAKVRIAYFDFVQDGAGDANSTVDLVKVPSGRVRILTSLSHIVVSDLGTGTTMDIGHTGWTKHDGTSQTAVVDAFADGLDTDGAALTVAPGSASWLNSGLIIDSKEGTTIQAKVLGAGIANAETISGWIAYVQD